MRRPNRRHAGLTGVLRGPFGLLWAGQTLGMLGDGVSRSPSPGSSPSNGSSLPCSGCCSAPASWRRLSWAPSSGSPAALRHCIVDGVPKAPRRIQWSTMQGGQAVIESMCRATPKMGMNGERTHTRQ